MVTVERSGWVPRGVLGLALVTAGLLGGWLLSGIQKGEAIPEAPAKIAVFDLERVFDASSQKKVLEEQFKQQLAERAQKLEDEKQAIEKLRESMNFYKEGSAEAERVQGEIFAREGQLRAKEKSFERDVLVLRNQFFDRVLDTIRGKVQRYADEHKIDAVFQKSFKMTEESPPWDSVFFWGKQLDITEDIIALVNS